MNNPIVSGLLFVVALLLPPYIARPQGMIYLSNLGGQASFGNLAVGSDSWLAESFYTGTNSGGYFLDSVQLAMTNASGRPDGFSLMLYSAIQVPLEYYPGSGLSTFNGEENPTNGIFTYSPVLNVTLLPRTAYFLVLTAGTPTNTGAYYWIQTCTSSGHVGGW